MTTPVEKGWSDRERGEKATAAPTRPLLGQYWSRLMTHPMAIWGATNPPLFLSLSLYIYTHDYNSMLLLLLLRSVLFRLANTDRHNMCVCVCFVAISRRSHPGVDVIEEEDRATQSTIASNWCTRLKDYDATTPPKKENRNKKDKRLLLNWERAVTRWGYK